MRSESMVIKRLASLVGSSPALWVYIGIAIFLLGALSLLGGVGVYDGDAVEPAALLAGILFGVVFGGSGGLIMYRALTRLMRMRLGNTDSFLVGVFQLLWSRVNARTLLAAAPNMVIALQLFYLAAVSDGLPWLQRGDLRYLVVLEFFAIHATAFLGLVSCIRWRGLWGIPQVVLFLGLMAIYAVVTHQVAGVQAAIGFVLLTLAKYVGHLARPPGFHAKAKMVLRWLTGSVVFVVLAGVFNVDLESQDNLLFASVYFLVLALFEAVDLMAPDLVEHRRSQAATVLKEQING